MIGTGTHATLDVTPGLAAAQPLTHTEALELETLPDHLIVIGGGYIGLEFAQAMRRLGSRVTIIERNARLLHREDADVSAAMEELFQDEYIALILDAKVEEVSGLSGESVNVTYTQDGVTKIIGGSHLLVATGRTPNTRGIGLDLAGVELTERGYIKVNERLQTTAPGTWAVGEVAGSPQFTHSAFDDFRVIRDNLAGKDHVTTGRQVPFSMFTDPEIAKVGLSETEAEAKAIPYRLFKIPMAADLRTRTLSETRGFMKALIGEDDRILGFTVFGVYGGEIMSMVQIAMIGGLPYTVLRDAILTHPTLAEGLTVLFSSAPVITFRLSKSALMRPPHKRILKTHWTSTSETFTFKSRTWRSGCSTRKSHPLPNAYSPLLGGLAWKPYWIVMPQQRCLACIHAPSNAWYFEVRSRRPGGQAQAVPGLCNRPLDRP